MTNRRNPGPGRPFPAPGPPPVAALPVCEVRNLTIVALDVLPRPGGIVLVVTQPNGVQYQIAFEQAAWDALVARSRGLVLAGEVPNGGRAA